MGPKAFRITAPFLTDEERRAITHNPGGLSGQTVDTSKLLGPWKPRETGRRFPAASMFTVALQAKSHIYAGPVDAWDPGYCGRRLTSAKIAKRRARNKVARASRRANRLAAKQ